METHQQAKIAHNHAEHAHDHGNMPVFFFSLV